MAAQHQQQLAVIGAVAYDQISTTDTLIANRARPLLNCKLTSLHEQLGGCGGNLAYNLSALGSAPLLATCSGMADDARYLAWCDERGIETRGFLRTPGAHCARAIIMTDPQGKQFTAFFPGPVPGADRWRQHLSALNFTASSIFLIAPYPAALMQASLQHASELRHKPLKIWCPGQYADQLSQQQVNSMVRLSDWIVGNSHEIEHLRPSEDVLAEKLVIKTDGEGPVTVTYPDASSSTHPVETIDTVTDPTGCGDAFLAAMAHHVAMSGKVPWRDVLPGAVAAGNQAASACLKQAGGQQHQLSTA